MSITQGQLMQECFDGERERNCTYCPAHHSKNGRCCFGHRFEYEDPQCHSCPHVTHCEPATMRFLDQQSAIAAQPRRIVINRPSGSAPTAPSTTNFATQPVYGNATLVRRDGGMVAPQTRVAKPMQFADDESFWKMMGVNAAWGAVEGMLEMLLGFFRQRRPD
jgi:hypothetical protein